MCTGIGLGSGPVFHPGFWIAKFSIPVPLLERRNKAGTGLRLVKYSSKIWEIYIVLRIISYFDDICVIDLTLFNPLGCGRPNSGTFFKVWSKSRSDSICIWDGNKLQMPQSSRRDYNPFAEDATRHTYFTLLS